MKKLLGILVLGLLWCNIGFAQELIRIPVHVHIVQIEEGDYKTITTPEDVREDFKNANWIWAQANIFFKPLASFSWCFFQISTLVSVFLSFSSIFKSY